MMIRRLCTEALITYRNAVDRAFSRKYLLYTNILISMGISTCGDLLAQSYEVHEKAIESYDFSRTSQMAFSGSTAGVICHHWYIILDKVIIGRTLDMAIKKLLMDQFICSPVVILSFFATVAIFEDDPFANFTEEVRDKFWTLYKAEWVVWPPAQLFNFYFLPTRFRVAYDNTISLGYDMFTSHIKHSKRFETEKTQKKENLDTENS